MSEGSTRERGSRDAGSLVPIAHCRGSSQEQSFLTCTLEFSPLLPPHRPPVLSAPVNTHAPLKAHWQKRKPSKSSGVLKSCQNPSALPLERASSEPGLTPGSRLVPAALGMNTEEFTTTAWSC